MKRKIHPAVFLAVSLGCLSAALVFFAGLYPSTYGQPDFGYSFAVMLLILVVCLTTLSGLVVAVAGVYVTRRWFGGFVVVGTLHLLLFVSTPVVFKRFYEGNRPLHETMKRIPKPPNAGYVTENAPPPI